MNDEVRSRLTAVLNDQPTNRGLHVSTGRYVKVRAGDLIKLCEETPDHPQAKVFLRACGDPLVSADTEVAIHAIDLQAVLERREVRLVCVPPRGPTDRVLEVKTLV